MMAGQPPPSVLEQPSLDTDLPSGGLPAIHLIRHDTSSSTGSAKPIPKGNWTLNISGNCPRCHHHHNSVRVHVKATSDFSHTGDVSCEKCGRLWLGLGKRSSTRISLVSTKTIEAVPEEEAFRSTIIKMIRSATTIATLSPTLGSTTLADIPESSSAGPSRETSVRSTTHEGIQDASLITSGGVTAARKGLSSNFLKTGSARTSVRPLAPDQTLRSKHHNTGTPRFILRVGQKLSAKFPALKSSPLGRWFPDNPKLSNNRLGKQPIRENLSSSPTPVHMSMSHPIDAETETQNIPAPELKQHSLNICSSSTSQQDALDSLRAMDENAIQGLSPEQRIAWMREKLTTFKSLAKQTPPKVDSSMVDSGTQVDSQDLPPTRRHSVLAFVGNRFGSFQYFEIFRGSNSTLNGRRLSMSETYLSEADTAVEGMSVSSTPRHILLESLQRERSPRPHSFHSSLQNWQHALHARVEARYSFDSAATGNVRSITPARGRARNRLSRASGRTSTIYVTEPSSSQVQLAQTTNEQPEQSGDQERHDPPSESPPSS